MRAVVIASPGGPEVLGVKEVEDPAVGQGDVLIRVIAAGLNRADTLQRKGFHPAPLGASSYPGLECSGVVEAVRQSVDRWKVGDQVCSLIAGGGYAEKVAVPLCCKGLRHRRMYKVSGIVLFDPGYKAPADRVDMRSCYS